MARMAAVAVLLLALLVAVARACDTPVGGCTVKNCAAGTIAWYLGTLKNSAGSFNFEGFVPETCTSSSCHNVISYSSVSTKNACCSKCASTTNCAYWKFYDSSYTKSLPKSKNNCYLFDKDHRPTTSSTYNKVGSACWVGGYCNPGSMTNDPHLLGARGTPYDFNGELDQSFCLVSDKDVHVNMLLEGYFDNRTAGATVLKNGKALRTWAKEVGVIFKTGSEEHKLRLVARRSTQQERGSGFLAKVELDGKTITLPKVGASLNLGGQAKLHFVGYEKTGPYDVDFYAMTVPGLMIMELRMRIANPQLQSATDAEAHFNLAFAELRTTPQVHGVLGQTYRVDRERVERALKYSAQVELLGHAIAADGASGAGFLDGSSHDYISSSVTASDCKFSAYNPARTEEDVIIQMPAQV